MIQDILARINQLAKMAKQRPLTPAELAERDTLRQVYLANFRAGLQQQLDNTALVDEAGNVTPLTQHKRRENLQ